MDNLTVALERVDLPSLVLELYPESRVPNQPCKCLAVLSKITHWFYLLVREAKNESPANFGEGAGRKAKGISFKKVYLKRFNLNIKGKNG